MLEVGIAAAEITPEKPQYMCGYVMRTEKSKGIDEDLTVTALTLKVDGQMLILISGEIAIIDEEMTQAVRNALSQKYGIPEKMISVCATHTHSAPVINTAIDGEEKFDKEYRQYVISQMVKAVGESIANIHTANKTVYRYGKIEGVYGKRSDKSVDGDKWVHIVDFKNNDVLLASMVNFSCHGTVLGPDNYILSADLPGEIRRAFKEKYNALPIVLNGNSGDMGNRQFRLGNDLKELKRVGVEVFRQISAFNEEKEINIESLIFEEVNQEIRYKIDKKKLNSQIAQIELKLEKEEDYDKRKLLKSEQAFLNERLLRDKLDVNIDIKSLIYKLGDLAIVTIPGELFSELGLKLKNDSKYKPTLILGYANNFNAGYLVSERDYGDGYESITTEIPKGKPEELIAEISKHLKK